MRTSFYFVIIVFLTSLQDAGAWDTRPLQEKFLTEALGTLDVPKKSELRPYSNGERVQYWLRDYFIKPATPAALVRQQTRRIRLLVELNEPIAFGTLLDHSLIQYQPSQEVREAARWALLYHFSVISPEERDIALLSFRDQIRNEEFEAKEKAQIASVTSVAESLMGLGPRLSKSESEVVAEIRSRGAQHRNYELLNLLEELQGIGSGSCELGMGICELLFSRPDDMDSGPQNAGDLVKPVTRIAGTLAVSVVISFGRFAMDWLTLRAPLGLLSNGHIGNYGRPGGEGLVNSVMWVLLLKKLAESQLLKANALQVTLDLSEKLRNARQVSAEASATPGLNVISIELLNQFRGNVVAQGGRFFVRAFRAMRESAFEAIRKGEPRLPEFVTFSWESAIEFGNRHHGPNPVIVEFLIPIERMERLAASYGNSREIVFSWNWGAVLKADWIVQVSRRGDKAAPEFEPVH